MPLAASSAIVRRRRHVSCAASSASLFAPERTAARLPLEQNLVMKPGGSKQMPSAVCGGWRGKSGMR